MIATYRIAHFASITRKRGFTSKIWANPLLVLYRFLTEWVFQYEIPAATIIGSPLIIDHGYGIVINKHSVLGDHIRIKHGVTIGAKTLHGGKQGPSPILGSNIDIGAHAILIGSITIGSNVFIGAGAVVVKDVPSDSIAVGNPARNISNITIASTI